MKDFKYYAPTEVIFGADSEKKLPQLVKKYGGTRVLIHYGGHSAEKSGLLGQIRQQLRDNGIEYVELGGVKPNPRLSLVHKGIEICRAEGIDLILAVGGGSVIDSAKAISVGVDYDGDVWEMYTQGAKAKSAIPIGVVLTIPAAGSEMSGGSVITREEGDLKRDYGDDLIRPKFAIMNPVRTYTLPAFQTACGATDIMMHTMERYFSPDDDMTITDNIAEAVLKTVLDVTPRILAEPENYRLRAQIMWAGSIAHNDLTGCGTTGDWATHNIEHELSGMFDVAHGAGLATVWPSWARYVCRTDIPRFARFAVNVMGVPCDFTNLEQTALDGIAALENFFRGIGMPVTIPELIGRKATEAEIMEMATKATDRWKLGSFQKLGRDDVAEIYRMANK